MAPGRSFGRKATGRVMAWGSYINDRHPRDQQRHSLTALRFVEQAASRTLTLASVAVRIAMERLLPGAAVALELLRDEAMA